MPKPRQLFNSGIRFQRGVIHLARITPLLSLTCRDIGNTGLSKLPQKCPEKKS